MAARRKATRVSNKQYQNSAYQHRRMAARIKRKRTALWRGIVTIAAKNISVTRKAWHQQRDSVSGEA